MSRFIAGTSQEIDIKSDVELKLYINREDLWNKENIDSDSFEVEIFEIFKLKILIGHTWDLYNILEGDNILNEELYNNKEKQEGKNMDRDANSNSLNNKDEEKKDEQNDNADNNHEGDSDEGGEEEEEEDEDGKRKIN